MKITKETLVMVPVKNNADSNYGNSCEKEGREQCEDILTGLDSQQKSGRQETETQGP